MAETPIIDAATKAIMECDEDSAWDSIASADCRNAAIAALRAALPWEPSQATIEVMAASIIVNGSSRLAALAVYRNQPILRELYPEKL
jgi:hypothetical protein